MQARERSQQVRAHIDEVLRPTLLNRDALILDSWQRCQQIHGLDPTRLQKAVVLSSSELRCHQDEISALMHTARVGMEELYRQIHQIGYVVLLTNAQGITVDFIGDRTFDNQLRKSGLYLGADWNEGRSGTCAVGTCIASGQPIIVHQTDHYDASHINLTCSAAPIYAPDGKLQAVLDISALRSPQNKHSQYMALKMVQIFSERIERSYFFHHFRDHLIFSFSKVPDFLEVAPDYFLATDTNGCILGFNHRLRQELLKTNTLIGTSLEQFFEKTLEQLLGMQHLPLYQRVVRTRSQQLPLFFSVRMPEQHITFAKSPLIAHPLDHTHGGDSALQSITQRLQRLLNSRVNIILGGETGTGKEYLARQMHACSARAGKPFIAINCAALPESLIESELFGYEQGAFTGSRRGGRIGLIEQANGGTLFLDEIGDMPLLLQSRLLRVLAEKELYPLGGSRRVALDLHVISATHQELTQLIAKGLFRVDLYYRLAGAEFILPALRARSDFDWLLARLQQALAQETSSELRFSPEALALMRQHTWPGNVRELKNLLAYLFAVKAGQVVLPDDLPATMLHNAIKFELQQTLTPSLERLCTQDTSPVAESMPDKALRQHLQQQHWNISAVARELGVARMTIYRQMKRQGIVPPHWR